MQEDTKRPEMEGSIDRRKFIEAAGVVGAAALAGCISGDGGGGGTATDTSGDDGGGDDSSSETFTLNLLTTYTSPASKKSYRQANAKFKDQYSNAEVKMGFTSWEKIYNRLVQAARTGNWPDMAFFLDNELNLLLHDQGFTDDPKKLMEPALESVGPLMDDVPKTHYQNKDGSFYTMQSNNQSNEFWYRTDVLEDVGMGSAPKSWVEELELVKKAHEADNDLYGTAISTAKNNYCNTVFYARLRGAGGNAVDPEKNVTIDSQVTRDLLEHWGKLAEYGAPGKETFSYGDIYTNFATDKTASCYYWGRTYINVIEQTPEIADKVSVVPNPQPDNDKASPDETSVMSGDGGQLMAKSENKEAAAQWWSNYIKPEFFVEQFMVGTPGNTTPIFEGHRDAWYDFDVWKDYEHGKEIRDNLVKATRQANPKCRPGLDYPAMPELANIARKHTMSGPGSAYWAGQTNVDDAVKEMSKMMEQEIASYSS